VLLRFLPYDEGSVTLDGVELAELDGDAIRRVVGLVAQDAHVFDNTLEENLRLAKREATEKELDGALGAARLLDWTRELPAGLQTEVGERGARMSGGQRQRLAIARALLADFGVLILDEPGEHLDTRTADAIVADLLAITEGRTTLLITHRLTGLEDVDEVLVLDHGRVLERGTHTELLTLGGRYAALWRREQETVQPPDYEDDVGGATGRIAGADCPEGVGGGADCESGVSGAPFTRARNTWNDQP
jgi:ABC-type multidrug transport system fused ATPase/permease subunit